MERKIRVISRRLKYRKHTFPAIPRYDDRISNYVTGQHFIPGAKEGLTKDEIEDPNKISAAKSKKYPFVIQANYIYNIRHMQSLDLSTDESGEYINAKDKAMYDFYKLQTVVAESKSKFIPDSEHIFYLEDLELEAQEEITTVDRWYEAMSKVKTNTSLTVMYDLALFLNHYIKNFYLDPDKTPKMLLEKRIYDACKTNPDDVLRFFEDGAEETLFILKLARYGIIRRSNSAYYDGEKYLGSQISEVITLLHKKEGEEFKEKWGRLLLQKNK